MANSIGKTGKRTIPYSDLKVRYTPPKGWPADGSDWIWTSPVSGVEFEVIDNTPVPFKYPTGVSVSASGTAASGAHIYSTGGWPTPTTVTTGSTSTSTYNTEVRMQTIEARLNALQAENSTLQMKVRDVETELITLKGQLYTEINKRSELAAQLEELSNKPDNFKEAYVNARRQWEMANEEIDRLENLLSEDAYNHKK